MPIWVRFFFTLIFLFIYLFFLWKEKEMKKKNGIWVCQRIKEREERERERSNSLSQILLYFFVLRHLKNKMKIKRLCVCVWQIFFCCSFFFLFVMATLQTKTLQKVFFVFFGRWKKQFFWKSVFVLKGI